MKTYPFNALVSRMKYIRRWSLMHAARPETLSEHTAETAILAHTLCLIAREVTGTPVRPETVAVAALYHDAPEIMTGDMPTPVKYKNERLRSAYKALEEESARQMADLLPPALRIEMTGYLTGRCLSEAEKRILKAADRLSAAPGTRAAGAVTYAVHYYAAPRTLFTVQPGSFYPPPKVTSAVIQLRLHEAPPVTPRSAEAMFRVIRAAFSQRRKTAANAASAGLHLPKEAVAEALAAAGVPPTARPEQLTLQNYADVSDALFAFR